MKKEVQKGNPCPHKGEYPEREKFFSLHQEFTWRLLGIDMDTLCIECSVCGWHKLTHNVDRLDFFLGRGIDAYLPEHP